MKFDYQQKLYKIDNKNCLGIIDKMNQTQDMKTLLEESQIKEYISGLSEQEKIVLKIAQEHLETSFDISKSIGFLVWKQRNVNEFK